MIDIGDFVLIEGVAVDDDEIDPNGFTGIITSATLLMDDTKDLNNGEVVFHIQLPVAWDEGKHEWTFKEEELILLESEVV